MTEPLDRKGNHPPQHGRRRFLKNCAAGAVLASGAGQFIPSFATAPKSKVVIAQDTQLRGGGSSPDSGRLGKMLDRAMQSLCGSDSPQQAWKSVARPGQVVGLKVNCLGGRGVSTNVLLAELICDRLQEAGFPKNDIVIWDRLNADLESSGFRVTSGAEAIRCMGNDIAGYEEDLEMFGSVASRVAKTLTQECDVVINLPVLKDHSLAGVTLALKNLFGAIHNPSIYHPNLCNPYIADLNMLPTIRQKVRLHICDGITAQYEGGPTFTPQWSWPYNGVLVSRDPVALDYTGWQILEKKRAEKGLKSLGALGRAPIHIATAADARHRLGTNDPGQIEVVEL